MNPTLSTENFRNWMPTRIYEAGGESRVDWAYFENVRFTEPFFESSVRFRGRDSAQRPLLRRTSLDVLKDLREKSPGIEPSGFIFHVSRCGSTLVSQMLAATAENIVISEAPPIDAVIRGLPGGESDFEARAEHLKWVVNAYGRKRFRDEKHFFIKFDCWHTLDLKLITSAFPEVPWIFLYRNPVEVVVSHLRRRGMQMMPGAVGALLPGFKPGDLVRMPPEEYCARVVGRICEAALRHVAEPNGLPVNYNELPEAVFTKVFAHFNVAYELPELAAMRAATKRDAKTPQIDFTPDAANKNAEASDSVKEVVAEYAAPVYEKLEKARLNS